MERKTMNLRSSDWRVIRVFLDEGPARDSLAAVVEPDTLTSESSVLRALALVGARAVLDRSMDEGYAELARCYGDEDEAFEEASARLATEAWSG